MPDAFDRSLFIRHVIHYQPVCAAVTEAVLIRKPTSSTVSRACMHFSSLFLWYIFCGTENRTALFQLQSARLPTS
jgi:hypothetical protein